MVADKAEAYCPRLEGLAPWFLRSRNCLDTYELLNKSAKPSGLAAFALASFSAKGAKMNSRPSKDGRKCDIHLIELESIFLAGTIGSYRAVIIEDIIDELRPLGLWQPPRPFHEPH